MILLTLTAALLAPPPAPPPAPPSAPAVDVPGLIEFLPGVRINRAERVVEFDGAVAVDAHDPETPHVYLEVIVCGPDTREHEALVVTPVKASLIHAGLLAVGSEPGRPARVELGPDGRAKSRPAEGAPVRVELVTSADDGSRRVAQPYEWIVHVRDRQRPPAAYRAFVHAGSRLLTRRDPATGTSREVFDADGTGQVIGLHTFGSELIALRPVLNPEASAEEPVWIADTSAMPRRGTPVVIRLRVEPPAEGAER